MTRLYISHKSANFGRTHVATNDSPIILLTLLSYTVTLPKVRCGRVQSIVYIYLKILINGLFMRNINPMTVISLSYVLHVIENLCDDPFTASAFPPFIRNYNLRMYRIAHRRSPSNGTSQRFYMTCWIPQKKIGYIYRAVRWYKY
jgi:hypothetical protein